MAIKIVSPKAPAAPAMPASVASDYSAIQQHFPAISAKIALMWGSVGLQGYLNNIIIDERGGRQGFSMHVLSALMRLHEYHATLVPQVESGDTWDHIA